jgi:hypothetical protein
MKAVLLFAAVAAAMVVETAHAQPNPCPDFQDRRIVDIPGSTDPAIMREQRKRLLWALRRDNTIVRLGPNAYFDFSDLPDASDPKEENYESSYYFPIRFGRCVTLTSVASFDVHPWRAPQARTPRSLGPMLRYGKHRGDNDTAGYFLKVDCDDADPIGGVGISGFRLHGPDFGEQSTEDYGISIGGCIDVEVSNMEIAGWGGAGVRVAKHAGFVTSPQEILILIHDNFIHHNQHQAEHWWWGHAVGYGVDVRQAAWAKIYRNVFDFNRHSIAANGLSGGYYAEHNLVLKGGGHHGTVFNTYTHSFDVHGTGCIAYTCGNAGIQHWFYSNAFQYQKDNDIKIRGIPAACCTFIDKNIFPLSEDKAIELYKEGENVKKGPLNVYEVDTFGHYGVCDFDGDGIDDLFLATGATWWFSSSGEYQWSFLNAKTERFENLRLGYFDDDNRCDVLAERDGEWVISSGGISDWISLGAFDKPLKDVWFGRFDPRVIDDRPGVTRRTTHAWWRKDDGQWFVTPLSHKDWQPVQSSGFPMKALRFGDFTGHGNTDVLAVEEGRWAISESATGGWSRLNEKLNDPVENLFIANMDPDDNIDDILRLDRDVQTTEWMGINYQYVVLTWWRSKNGRGPWEKWRSYVFYYPLVPETVPVFYGFAGRFGGKPGGGTMVIDEHRTGRFFSLAEKPPHALPNWESWYPY